MAKAGKERFVRAVLTLLAAFPTFAEPTYLLYIVEEPAFPRLVLLLLGLASFTMGIVLFVYLLGGKEKLGLLPRAFLGFYDFQPFPNNLVG